VTTILVIEDEPHIARALAINLRAAGYGVITAGDGTEGLAAAVEHRPDAVVLDLGLPDMDGVSVITGLREWSELPILVLSGRSEGADKVDALDAGADDYVTKPFGMDELLARIRVILRRTARPAEEILVRFGAAEVDLVARRVSVAGEDVRLTPTEWHLLDFLVQRPGQLLSQRELLAAVWGPGYETAQGNLRFYINQLRRKLEPDPSRPVHFRNEPGLGYRFEP
jgi:two-component system KDP operon response regulator KdpE